jgi:hypothetical protein
MLIELKIIFFPRETFGSESEKCDFGLTGKVLPKFRTIMVYLHLQNLAAQDGSLLYIFLNCLLSEMKTLGCFKRRKLHAKWQIVLFQKARVFIFPSHSMPRNL